jgi:hypothetical protein
MDLARGSGEITGLVSPVIAGGLPAPRFDQLFLLARSQGRKQPQEWAAYCWQVLVSQAQRVVKEGKPLMTPEENLQELTALAREFAEKRLPILRAAEIA